MKDIKELIVFQVRIFPVDYIHYNYILRSDYINHMSKKFNFHKHEMPFEAFQKNTPNILIFHGGEYNYQGNKIIIQRLAFEDRRIILETLTSSKVAKKIFDSIATETRKFDPLKNFKRTDSVFFAEETSCVSHLKIDYMRIYSKNFINFIDNKFANLLEHKYFEIAPKTLSFEVRFQQDNELLNKRAITLSPKLLIIEPKAGNPLSEKVFFTKSPFDSDTHLQLIENFETAFKA
jgi:hypothetical protein